MYTSKTAALMAAALTLSGCASAAGSGLSHISLERDCNGCASGRRVELFSDGRVLLTTLGKARMGTADAVVEKRVSPAEFEEIARLAIDRGVFAMADEYADPQLQDGAWSSLRVERAGGAAKQVFRRDGAGPKALDSIEQALDKLQERLSP